MSRNSDYSYIHMDHPSYIVYMQEWSKDELPFDDIEIHERFLNDINSGNPSDSTDAHNGNNSGWPNSTFGSSINNRALQKKFRENAWKDLDLKRFLAENHSSLKQNAEEDLEGIDEQKDVGHNHRLLHNFSNEPFDNSVGGIRVVDHDHTILRTVQRRTDTYPTLFGASMTGVVNDTGLSFDRSPNTTGTTTTSLSHNTNRLTVSDPPLPARQRQLSQTQQSHSTSDSIFNTP